MISISLCLIVRNEEDVLARCLDSVKGIADEIIVVDTGSIDRTKKIASSYTPRVYDFEWIDDFAAARNYAFGRATSEYILWLDADDIFLEEDQVKLLELKASLSPEIDAVSMFYHLSKDENGNVTNRLRRNRLVKRSRQFRWIGAVHEYLEVYGAALASDIAVTHASTKHDSDRNLRIYENRLANGEEFSPRDLYYYANELKDHGRFEKAILYYNRFLRTQKGWAEDTIGACGKLADCYAAIGDQELALESALRSFRYGSPRADNCCRIGYYHLQSGAYETAAFWYESALRVPSQEEAWSMQNTSCSTWLPHLQLCVCYDKLGHWLKAYEHNEIARGYRPDHPSVLHNKTYLEALLMPEQPLEASCLSLPQTAP